jgi:hypothetical protein
LAEQAIEQYKHVLEMNSARDQESEQRPRASPTFTGNMKKFDEAKKYDHMASEIDPNDPEPYYSVGVIDWTQMLRAAHGGARPARHEAG